MRVLTIMKQAVRVQVGVLPKSFAVVAVLSLAGLGCTSVNAEIPASNFTLGLQVKSDTGKPLQGATISRDAKVVATTGADGRAQFTTLGRDGTSLTTNVACPAGFTSPTSPVTFKLARLAEPSRVVEVDVVCPRASRQLVVALKLENGAHLPVKVLNQVVARTDESGAATFTMDVAPRTPVQVMIDTSDHPELKPESPTVPVNVDESDDIKVIAQKFELPKKKAPKPQPKKDPRPKCIGCAPS